MAYLDANHPGSCEEGAKCHLAPRSARIFMIMAHAMGLTPFSWAKGQNIDGVSSYISSGDSDGGTNGDEGRVSVVGKGNKKRTRKRKDIAPEETDESENSDDDCDRASEASDDESDSLFVSQTRRKSSRVRK